MRVLSFEDWLDMYGDVVPTGIDLYDAYDSYVDSCQEQQLETDLLNCLTV